MSNFSIEQIKKHAEKKDIFESGLKEQEQKLNDILSAIKNKNKIDEADYLKIKGQYIELIKRMSDVFVHEISSVNEELENNNLFPREREILLDKKKSIEENFNNTIISLAYTIDSLLQEKQ